MKTFDGVSFNLAVDVQPSARQASLKLLMVHLGGQDRHTHQGFTGFIVREAEDRRQSLGGGGKQGPRCRSLSLGTQGHGLGGGGH